MKTIETTFCFVFNQIGIPTTTRFNSKITYTTHLDNLDCYNMYINRFPTYIKYYFVHRYSVVS